MPETATWADVKQALVDTYVYPRPDAYDGELPEDDYFNVSRSKLRLVDNGKSLSDDSKVFSPEEEGEKIAYLLFKSGWSQEDTDRYHKIQSRRGL